MRNRLMSGPFQQPLLILLSLGVRVIRKQMELIEGGCFNRLGNRSRPGRSLPPAGAQVCESDPSEEQAGHLPTIQCPLSQRNACCLNRPIPAASATVRAGVTLGTERAMP